MIARTFCAGGAALALVSIVAHGQVQPAPYAPRYERPIARTAEGAQRLAVDVSLLVGVAPFDTVRGLGGAEGIRPRAVGGLSDLRLFDADGREIGYLLVYSAAAGPQWLGGAILPIAAAETATRKTSGFEVDLGAAQPIDMIRLEGLPAPFLKPLVLEASGDRERWTVLVAEGTLFDLPQERLRQVALPFAAGAYRYVRVTWDDTHSGRVPLPHSVVVRRAGPTPSGAPLTTDLAFERRPSEPGRSRYRVRLPRARLPIVALTLDVGGGHVFRTLSVSESRLTGAEAVPAEIGRGTIARITRSGATASQLRVPIAPPREPELDLVVDDGNNPPLELIGIVAEFAELPWIYFEAPGGPIVARYGDPRAAAPSYDLEAARPSVRIGDVPAAAWGDPREMPSPPSPSAARVPMPETGAPIDPTGFRVQRLLPEGPAGLVALTVDAALLAGSRGADARFADVRIVDAQGRQVPYLVERREEPLTLDLALTPFEATARELRSAGGRQRSAHSVSLPYKNLPPVRLVVETSARVFRRSVQVGVERPPDRRHRETWFEVLAASSWQHADESSPAPPLTLPIQAGAATDLVVMVEEGDNRQLPIVAARALLPSYWLRFYHPAGALRLVYGRDDLSAPQYDLALLAPQVMGASAREIVAAPPETTAPESAPQLVSPLTFWIGLGLAVVVLLGIVVRLMRS